MVVSTLLVFGSLLVARPEPEQSTRNDTAGIINLTAIALALRFAGSFGNYNFLPDLPVHDVELFTINSESCPKYLSGGDAEVVNEKCCQSFAASSWPRRDWRI